MSANHLHWNDDVKGKDSSSYINPYYQQAEGWMLVERAHAEWKKTAELV